MSPQPLSRRLSALFVFLALGTLALAKSKAQFQAIDGNTFAITRTATTGFDRDVEKFTQEAKEDAGKYCADKGKTLKILSVTSEQPHYGGGYSWAKVVFKALDAGDPALTAPEPAPALVASGGTTTVTGVLPTYAGDLYAELLKLDDLRKRGLLTDKEFEQEKKKLLKRSK
jgi:hypothetical protein